eukprot:1111586-Pelagomonas_calceolata.AAC.4
MKRGRVEKTLLRKQGPEPFMAFRTNNGLIRKRASGVGIASNVEDLSWSAKEFIARCKPPEEHTGVPAVPSCGQLHTHAERLKQHQNATEGALINNNTVATLIYHECSFLGNKAHETELE